MKIHRPEFLSLNDSRGDLEGVMHFDLDNLFSFLVTELPSDTFLKVKQLLKGKVAILKNISVSEQGVGNGNSLVSDFLEQCSQRGTDYVCLVADLNEEQLPGFNLVKWYESFGFEKVGESYAGPFMVMEI